MNYIDFKEFYKNDKIVFTCLKLKLFNVFKATLTIFLYSEGYKDRF